MFETLPTQYFNMLLIICPLTFLAGLVDSIAGGGGILSIPAYLLAGLPAQAALGTNKFAMSIGTAVSTGKYLKNGQMDVRIALATVPTTVMGAFIGTRLALGVDERYLKMVLVGVLPLIAIFLLSHRRFSRIQNKTTVQSLSRHPVLLAMLAGLLVGSYDGFLGPGTGTFLILIFTGLIQLDWIKASGSSKLVNLVSGLTSLVTYLMHGKVLLVFGMPAAVCTVLGNMIGAHLAIKNGERLIRPIIAAVLTLLFLTFLIDLIRF